MYQCTTQWITSSAKCKLKRARVEETFVSLQQIVDRCVVSAARPSPVVDAFGVVVVIVVEVVVVAANDVYYDRSQVVTFALITSQILRQLSQPLVEPQA